MSEQRVERWLWIGAALLAVFTITRGIGPHDEGLMLQGASRVAHGQWPYRDFWSNYPPGQFVLLAALQKVFGTSLLWWRVLDLVIGSTVSVLAYRLVARDADRPWALLAWLGVALAMAWPTTPGPNPTALALGLGALLAAPGGMVLAGGLAGLAAWFRIEIGVACAIGALIAAAAEDRAALGRSAADVAEAFVAVSVVAWAPFVIAAHGDIGHDLVGFLGQQHLQRLPIWHDPHTLKPDKVLEAVFALLLLAAGGGWLVWIAWRRPRLHKLTLLPLALVGAAYLVGRADEFHLVPLSVALAIGLAIEGRTVLLVGVAVIALNGLDRRGEQAIHHPAMARVPSGVGDGVTTDPADAAALRKLVPYVRRRVPAGRPVFVAIPRYDRVHVGDPLLNVILERPNPTRYDVMQPGIVTTAKVQREIVGSLAHTRLVVMWHDPRATAVESNSAAHSSGVFVLQHYLETRFRPVRRFGVYAVLVRR